MTLAMAPLTARRRALLGALATGTTYGDPACEVSCHETHGSWVFVAPDRVLKVKKPLKLSFLDYGTRERRGAMCREEVRINRRLAPELYLGTVGLVPRADGGVDLDPDDEAFESVEPAVLMRRFDERDTLASRLEAGTATPAQLRALGARLAAFHAAYPHAEHAAAAYATLRDAVRATLDDLALARDVLPGADVAVTQLRGTLETVLAARREELLERGARGLVVDGHGDLRAEHVLLTDPIQVVDAVEFDPGLRLADVACDLGFLVMDIEGRQEPDLAAALVAGYRTAGGDPGDDALLAAMACYRALVRAKVDVVRAGQGEPQARRPPPRGSTRRSRSGGAPAGRSCSPCAGRRPPARPRSPARSATRATWCGCRRTARASSTPASPPTRRPPPAPTRTRPRSRPTGPSASTRPPRWRPAAAP